VCMDAHAMTGVACVAPGAQREARTLSAAGKEQAKKGAATSGKRARGGPADARSSAADGARSSDALAAFAKVVKCARGSRLQPASHPVLPSCFWMPEMRNTCTLGFREEGTSIDWNHSPPPMNNVLALHAEPADAALCPARPATAHRRPAAARCCWRTLASACRGAAAPAATCAGILPPSPCRSAAQRLLPPHDAQRLVGGLNLEGGVSGAQHRQSKRSMTSASVCTVLLNVLLQC